VVKILKGDVGRVKSVTHDLDDREYRDGFDAGAMFQADAVSKATMRVDLNLLLEQWMAEGKLEGMFEEFVKERIGA